MQLDCLPADSSDTWNMLPTVHLQKIFVLFVISCISSESEAGIIRTLTRLVQRIDSILRPKDYDVVSYLVQFYLYYSSQQPILYCLSPASNGGKAWVWIGDPWGDYKGWLYPGDAQDTKRQAIKLLTLRKPTRGLHSARTYKLISRLVGLRAR